MKQKIIERLKALLVTLNVRNLSNTRIDAIAAKLAEKITDETQIDQRLTDLNDAVPFADIAKQDDQLRDAQAKLKKTEKDPADPKPADPIEPAKPADDAPEWAKQMAAENKKLADQLSQVLTASTAKTQRERLMAILKEKKVDQAYLDDPFRKDAIESKTFKTEEELIAYADNVVAEYGKFAQAATNLGLKNQPAPIMGVVKDEKTEVSPMMQGYIKEKKEADKKTA